MASRRIRLTVGPWDLPRIWLGSNLTPWPFKRYSLPCVIQDFLDWRLVGTDMAANVFGRLSDSARLQYPGALRALVFEVPLYGDPVGKGVFLLRYRENLIVRTKCWAKTACSCYTQRKDVEILRCSARVHALLVTFRLLHPEVDSFDGLAAARPTPE